MLRKEKKDLEYSSQRISASAVEEKQSKQGHQIATSGKEELSLGGPSQKAELSLDRHHNRDYKVPFVQLLPSPCREELSFRSSLDSGVHTTLSADSLSSSVHGDVMCQNCFRLKQIWVKSPRHAFIQQQEKVMEEMTLKQSLSSHEGHHLEGNSDFDGATSLEGELVCLQKMTKHQQEMCVMVDKTLCSLLEQQKLSEMKHLKQKQEITKLKAEVTELEDKNQTLLNEKQQLIEELTNLKQQVEVVNAKAEVYREDFETERGDREKAIAHKEQYRSEMLSLQKQLQQAKDILIHND